MLAHENRTDAQSPPETHAAMPATQPMDDHNKRLVANVHPPHWTNPIPSGRYNLVVIGAGTAGLVAASAAAQMGAKVALIERELMGGDCLNVGCVPSKGIISAARVAASARDASQFGINVGNTSSDFAAVMERMRRLRANISRHDGVSRFAEIGVDVYLADARFVDANSVKVGNQTLHFKKAVIATGARAAAPPIDGLDQIDYLTNETVFSLTELPKRFGIIGAGPIGCEMAQAFARLGSEVWLVESEDRILGKEDADAAEIVKQAMLHDGVNILCCGKQLKLKSEDGIRMTVDSGGRVYDQAVDQLLVAVGRKPNVDCLNLEAAGVEYDRKRGVEVNDRLQTTNPKIFAAGDVCSKYKFTHAADFMARTVLRNALFFGRGKQSDLTIPWCTYTSPEVAHVGFYPHQAAEQGIEIDTFEQKMEDVDRASLDGETQGYVRVHVKKGTDKIVGATIVASHAGDMIAHVTFAMTHGMGLGKIANTIHPYPTQAEAIRKVGDAYNKTRLTPFVKSILSKWLAWIR
jgi:pyruvate/2-oxoglutarate dehydrogenase complex dihydrolipoamide dehydrogenase (E3) component